MKEYLIFWKIVVSLLIFSYPFYILMKVNYLMMEYVVTDEYIGQWFGLKIFCISGVITIYGMEMLGAMIVGVLIDKITNFLGMN